MSYTETEIKLHIKDLETLARRLESLSAILISPRTHEMNLRFDTPAGTLTAQARVLRLRQDALSRLTYKGPARIISGVVHREEIEFTVSDFDAALRFLEALGYQIFNIYEKYRTTYEVGNLHIMLDEMPYGSFIEIEGEDPTEIHALAKQLSLHSGRAAKMSYLEIFQALRTIEKLDIKNLTFTAFEGQHWDLGKIPIIPADQ